MKVTAAIVGVIVCITLAVLACRVVDSASEASRRVQLRSDVHEPLRQCLGDIVKTHDRGDPVLAEQKTRLLQQRWSEYLNGGRVPEQFSSEVMGLGTAATRPAR